MPKILPRATPFGSRVRTHSYRHARDPHANYFTMHSVRADTCTRSPAWSRCGITGSVGGKISVGIFTSCINAVARCCCSAEQQSVLHNWCYVPLSLCPRSPWWMNQVPNVSRSARTLTQRFLRITRWWRFTNHQGWIVRRKRQDRVIYGRMNRSRTPSIPPLLYSSNNAIFLI